MKNIEVNKKKLMMLKDKAIFSPLDGQNGYVFPVGNKIFKIEKIATNDIIYHETVNYHLKNSNTFYLLQKLGDLQPNIKLSKFPISTLTYSGNYFGNVQLNFLNYSKMRDLINNHEISLEFLRKHLLETLEIVKELGEYEIEYCDLHPSNLLFDGNETILIDFDDPDRVKFTENALKVNYSRMYVYILYYLKSIRLKALDYQNLKDFIENIEVDSIKNGMIK